MVFSRKIKKYDILDNRGSTKGSTNLLRVAKKKASVLSRKNKDLSFVRDNVKGKVIHNVGIREKRKR